MFRNDFRAAAIFLALCLLFGNATARAASFADAIAPFAADSFSDTEAAIAAVPAAAMRWRQR